MKNKFLSTCIGVSMVLLGASAFILSIGHLTAASTGANKLITGELGKCGKYNISIGLGRDGYLYAVALNSESGKTEVYYYNTDAIGKWQKFEAKLPDFTF